jgi:hypothetical protein
MCDCDTNYATILLKDGCYVVAYEQLWHPEVKKRSFDELFNRASKRTRNGGIARRIFRKAKKQLFSEEWDGCYSEYYFVQAVWDEANKRWVDRFLKKDEPPFTPYQGMFRSVWDQPTKRWLDPRQLVGYVF